MSLDDLNKEIYKESLDGNISGRTHEQSAYDPKVGISNGASPFDQQENWNRPQKGMTPSQKRKLWVVLAVLLVVVLAIGGFFFYRWWQKNAFHQDRVSISFEGPKEADSTQQMKYIIHYANNNRVALEDVEIWLNYSENFQPTDNLNLKRLSPTSSKVFIGDIKSMSEGSVELKGIFYAPKDFPVYLNGEIHFVPSNGIAELSMSGKIGVNITAAPVVLEISAPQQAVDGDGLEYVVDYRNIDSKLISDVRVKIDFPQGFQFSSATPKPSGVNDSWYIGNLEAGQTGKIRIQGNMKGVDNEGKNVIVSLGHVGEDNKFVVYSKQESTTKIVSPVLRISQKLDDKVDGIVNAGELLKYSITFENTGDIGLRDAIINAEVNGKILDFSKISVEKGSYDGSKNLITWKASEVSELSNIAPKAKGVVRFSIPVKTIIPVENKLDKNFVISSVAKIDSLDIPTPVASNKIIGSNKMELKLASKVLFDVKGYYKDDKVKNSGPIPMETGKETTFAIHWAISNVSNDLSGARIVSALPSGVRWTGQIFPSDEKISYNERTNQIIWEAGNIPAGAGIFGQTRQVVFQVGVTPQMNQVGEGILLVNKSIFTATDTFVERDITIEGDEKDTQLYEDQTVGYVNGKVLK